MRHFYAAVALAAATAVRADLNLRGALITAAPIFGAMQRRQDYTCDIGGYTPCPGGPAQGCCPDGVACAVSDGLQVCAEDCFGNECAVGGCCPAGQLCPTVVNGGCTDGGFGGITAPGPLSVPPPITIPTPVPQPSIPDFSFPAVFTTESEAEPTFTEPAFTEGGTPTEPTQPAQPFPEPSDGSNPNQAQPTTPAEPSDGSNPNQAQPTTPAEQPSSSTSAGAAAATTRISELLLAEMAGLLGLLAL